MKAFLLVLLLSVLIHAQNWEQKDEVFAPSGVTVCDFSAPAFGDLDHDGDYDLVLGSIDNEIVYFRNDGTSQACSFKKDTSMFVSIYANGYQYTNADYPALLDLDNDGDLDLVIGGYNGFIYYQNKGNATSPVWVRVDSVFAGVNTQIGTDAKPAFADLDNDGDFDLVAGIGESLMGGPTSGIALGFRNTGTSAAPVFQSDNSLVTGIPDVGVNSYPAFADVDGDNDYDMLIGRDGAAVYYYKNTGNASAPVWTRDYSTFSSVESVNYWKDPVFCNLDGDNDIDLIYGTDNGHIYFYQNNGTPTAPQFVYNPDYFRLIKSDGWSTPSFADFNGNIVIDMISGENYGFFYARNDGTLYNPGFVQATSGFTNIDPGFRSSPVFIDIDADGDYDIVSGYSSGKLNLYVNNNGSFTANTTFFPAVQVSYASMPAFADIDADGDQDLLVGSDDANSSKFYLNQGNYNYVENTTIMAGVTFPSGTSPAFCDIDNDGDFDLFIGRGWTGTIDFYRNTGTPQSPVWTLNNALMSGIKVKQNAHPSFADLDGDGRTDMIIGEYDGNFTFYKNLFAVPLPVELSSFTAERRGGKTFLQWSTATEINNRGFEIQRSTDNNAFVPVGFRKGAGTTTEKQVYTFTDDLASAEKLFYRLKQVDYDGTCKFSDVIEINQNIPLGISLEQNYPNPFNPETYISYSLPQKSMVKLSIYDIRGELVREAVSGEQEAGLHKIRFGAEGLSSGVYIYRLQAGSTSLQRKMIIQK